MSYQTVTLYFMTGTGNSYRAATWIAEAAGRHGAQAELLPIGPQRPGVHPAGEGHLLGFLNPTHGFTAPWQMIRFVLGLPRGRGTHALIVPTRAGSKLGPWFLPGLEGTAGYLLALLLALKGYAVRGVQALDMPSNWTGLHPGFSPPVATAIVERARPRALRLADTVLSGGRHWGGWLPLLFGLALLPVSLGYLLVGRFFLSKLFFASGRCNGCGVCARNCPAGAIRMWGKKEPRPYWTFSCESCMRCMNFCPQNAIEAGHSWAVLLYFVVTIPAAGLVLRSLAERLPAMAALDNRWSGTLLQYAYTLLAIAASYLVFTLAIRVPAINRLFTLTTLTHYYRRYREPGTRLKDITPGNET